MSFDCATLVRQKCFVAEFGRGEEWLVFVGGISVIFGRARRNVQKSTRGWPHRRVCHYDSLTAQECAKIHTSHQRRSALGSPSAQECAKIHMGWICRKDSHVNCRARRNVQKITRRVIEKSVQLFSQRAGMCKNPHEPTTTSNC